jgi:hypothetical protein
MCIAALLPAGFVIAPTAANAATCTPSTESAIATGVNVIEVKRGKNQPLNSKVTIQIKEGQSATWTTSDSVGAVTGYGGSNLSVSRTKSNAVTYSVETSESYEIDLRNYPGAVRADFMAAVHVASYGWRDVHADCSDSLRWDEQVATIQQTGFRLVRKDNTEIWDWPTVTTPTVSGRF